VLPGTPKPCLLQPGAQLLDGIFGLAPTFEELASTIKDWERGFFHVEIRCRLVSRASGGVVAEGIGSCNSKEDKYRWRTAKPRCPKCGAEAIMRSKFDGGGFYCFQKAGGCNAKFPSNEPSITEQPTGRVENDEVYTLVNTISKMAQKRAHVGATLNATGASRIFTQDVEDLPPMAPRVEVLAAPAPKAAAQVKASASKPAERAPAPEPTPPPPTDPAAFEAEYAEVFDDAPPPAIAKPAGLDFGPASDKQARRNTFLQRIQRQHGLSESDLLTLLGVAKLEEYFKLHGQQVPDLETLYGCLERYYADRQSFPGCAVSPSAKELFADDPPDQAVGADAGGDPAWIDQ
jgi:hypothetical protein